MRGHPDSVSFNSFNTYVIVFTKNSFGRRENWRGVHVAHTVSPSATRTLPACSSCHLSGIIFYGVRGGWNIDRLSDRV